MTSPDHFSLSDEKLRTQINLICTYLETIELCLNDKTPLAKTVVQMLVDSVVLLAEEMQESVDGR